MTDLQRDLEALATATRHGYGFLAAYGLTWLVAGLLWRVRGARVGCYAALFQGLVALPVALGLTALTAPTPRPDNALLTSLSVMLSIGQLLMLPLAIVLILARRHDLVGAALAVTTAVHLVPYAWLYRTPVYVVIAVLVGVGVAALAHRGSTRDQSSGAGICALTGAVLMAGAGITLLL